MKKSPVDSLDLGQVWQERKRLKQEIRRAILAAMTLAENPKDRVIIEKFVDCIEPTNTFDTARLPYQSKNWGNAYSSSEVCCVFALIGELILRYWTFVANEDAGQTGPCRETIAQLKKICDNYDTLTVHGDPAKGYWLG